MNKYMVILHGDADEGTEAAFDQFSVIGPLPENYKPVTPINNFWEADVFEAAGPSQALEKAKKQWGFS